MRLPYDTICVHTLSHILCIVYVYQRVCIAKSRNNAQNMRQNPYVVSHMNIQCAHDECKLNVTLCHRMMINDFVLRIGESTMKSRTKSHCRINMHPIQHRLVRKHTVLGSSAADITKMRHQSPKCIQASRTGTADRRPSASDSESEKPTS